MSFPEYLSLRWGHILELTLEHLTAVGIALALSAVLSVSVGLAVYNHERAASAALAVAGTFLTIPSFALLALLIPPLGLGSKPTVVALTMYGLLPILRNTVAGLRGVDPVIVESARGMGMSRARRLLRVELPLAWPVMLTGIRVSALLLIGIATVAAAVNGPGLGQDILAGLSRIGSAIALNLVLGGMLGIVLLSLAMDGLFLGLRRLTTSRGISG